jgi:DNA-binding NarL/FixJ family response regulator
MRVLIAGRQETMRRALKTLLGTRPGLEVIGEAADKSELISQINTEMPDLLLLDEELSQELVNDVIVPLQQFDPCPAVLVLGDRAEARQAYLDAGAAAFINKSDPPKSLLTAIEEIRLRRNRV